MCKYTQENEKNYFAFIICDLFDAFGADIRIGAKMEVGNFKMVKINSDL